MFDKIEIYQLKVTDGNRAVRFMNLETAIKIRGRSPNIGDYGKVYETTRDALGIELFDPETILERVFSIFNIYRPDDYKARSLSVSDVVTLDGTAYYVDSFGFKKIENFKEETNAQKGRKIDHISGGKHNDSNTHT